MTPRLLALRAAVALAIVVVALALWQMSEAVQLLAIAVAISAGLAPLVSRVAALGLARSRAAATVFGLSLLVVGLLALGLGLLLADDLAAFIDRFPVWYLLAKEWLDNRGGVLSGVADRLPSSTQLVAALMGGSESTGEALLNVGLRLGALTTLAVGAAALGFFWLLDEQRIARLWLSLLPLGARTRVRAISSAVYREVGIYVRGVAVLVAFTTAALLVIYRLAGVPGGSALALAGGLAQVVPLLGPLVAVVPGALIALEQGTIPAAGVLAASATALALIRLVVAPRLLRHGIGVNPVLVIVLIMALAEMGGVSLVLLAPPLAAALQAATRALVESGRDEATRSQATRVAELEQRLAEVAQRAAANPDNLRLQSLVDRARTLLAEARQAT
jgi:predicted PurR-regulated permease PerM